MTPSPLIHDRTRTNRSRRRSTGNARARAKPQICPPLHRKRRRATPPPARQSRTHQQSDRPNRFNPNSTSQPPRPNPHSARGTAAASPTAISCLGAFRSPAASARPYLVMPATENLHKNRHAALAVRSAEFDHPERQMESPRSSMSDRVSRTRQPCWCSARRTPSPVRAGRSPRRRLRTKDRRQCPRPTIPVQLGPSVRPR